MAGNHRRVSFSQGDYPPRNRHSPTLQPKRTSLNLNIIEDMDATDHLEHSAISTPPESRKQCSNSNLSVPSIMKTRKTSRRKKSLLHTNETETEQICELNASETKDLSSHGIFLVPIEIFESKS